MTDGNPGKAEVLSRIDAWYLTEYIAFAGQIREYVADTLKHAFRTDPNSVRRSHHIIALVQLEYAAYEDAAALLMSLVAVRQGRSPTVLEQLESYRPGEAVLDSVFKQLSVSSPADLHDQLQLDRAMPTAWSDWFPGLDLPKATVHACKLFLTDCRGNQKPIGIAAYNKSKHGPLVLSRGNLLDRRFAPVPSMFFANRWPSEYGPYPVIIYGFEETDAAIEGRERIIHFVQSTLRLIVAVLLGDMYPAVVEARWGSVEGMWHSDELRDVIELIREITIKK